MPDAAFPAHATHAVDIMAPPASPHPIGTLPELLAAGINPQRYHSCSPSDNNSNSPVLGCIHAGRGGCKFRFPALEKNSGYKNGPRNGAVLTVSPSGGRDILEMPCYHYMSRLRDMRLSGNGFEWIGEEGSEYMAKASKEEIVAQTPKGPKVHVKLYRERRIVPAFPRPHENPLLENEIANVEVAHFVQEREDNRRRIDAIGTPDPRTALQKPDAYDKETTMETVVGSGEDEARVRAVRTPKAKTLTVHNVKKGPNAKTQAALARADAETGADEPDETP